MICNLFTILTIILFLQNCYEDQILHYIKENI